MDSPVTQLLGPSWFCLVLALPPEGDQRERGEVTTGRASGKPKLFLSVVMWLMKELERKRALRESPLAFPDRQLELSARSAISSLTCP